MNTRTQHTPGPWTATNEWITAFGFYIAVASPRPYREEMYANAALIADAPAMLQALRDLYEHCALLPANASKRSEILKTTAAIIAGKTLITKHTTPVTTTADIRKLSAALRARGIPHSPAQYDEAGKCLTCGESERCPGVHTFEEIQAAGRAALVCPVGEEHCDGCAGVRSPCPDARAQPSADPCKGCLNVGVANRLSCIYKKEPRT